MYFAGYFQASFAPFLYVRMCRQASDFQLVVEPFAWGGAAEGAQAPLLRLHTPTAAAARLSLPAGRHLARLLTDPHTLHALDLRCNVPFQLEDLNKVWNCISFMFAAFAQRCVQDGNKLI